MKLNDRQMRLLVRRIKFSAPNERVFECGHAVPADLPWYCASPCMECAKVPHPVTNPRAWHRGLSGDGEAAA